MDKEILEKLDVIISRLDETNNLLRAITQKRMKREKVSEHVNVKAVLELYNRILGGALGYVEFLTDKRANAIKSMANKGFNSTSRWEEYFTRVASSPFLVGINKSGWRASFDWLMRYDNAVKVMEGRYSSAVSIPEKHELAVSLVEKFAAGEPVKVQQSMDIAMLLCDISSAIKAHGLEKTRFGSKFREFVNVHLGQFADVIFSAHGTDDKQLLSAIASRIKRGTL